ncbi:hypothetical protein ACIQJX_35135 [Streptomyces griseoviridis]
MTRTDRLTLVRQMIGEGMSQRAIARRLHISKDTVRRDVERLSVDGAPAGRERAPLDAPDDAPGSAAPNAAAPQVSPADASGFGPADEPGDAPAGEPGGAPMAAPVAQGAPSDADAGAPCPAGVVQGAAPVPLPVRRDLLAGIDVSRAPALRRDLAILAQTGDRAEALVHQAVVAFAHAYRQAVARGEVEAGARVHITGMTLRQMPGRPPADAAPAGAA